MADSIILVGAGGHCKSCIEVIEAAGNYTIKGILDAKVAAGSRLLNYEVLGGDEKIVELAGHDNNYFLITVGQIESPGSPCPGRGPSGLRRYQCPQRST